MSDVQEHGSLPVPMHLRSGTWRERRDHGIGVGYRYPHDYPGADVDQEYLPEKLAGRRYYEPSDQGMETQIGARLDRVRSNRTSDMDAGDQVPTGRAGPAGGSATHPHGSRPKADAMKTASNVMRDREDRKRRLAEAQKREASE
jgi:hypothetical protein